MRHKRLVKHGPLSRASWRHQGNIRKPFMEIQAQVLESYRRTVIYSTLYSDFADCSWTIFLIISYHISGSKTQWSAVLRTLPLVCKWQFLSLLLQASECKRQWTGNRKMMRFKTRNEEADRLDISTKNRKGTARPYAKDIKSVQNWQN